MSITRLPCNPEKKNQSSVNKEGKNIYTLGKKLAITGILILWILHQKKFGDLFGQNRALFHVGMGERGD